LDQEIQASLEEAEQGRTVDLAMALTELRELGSATAPAAGELVVKAPTLA